MELMSLTAVELAGKIKSGELTAVDAAKAAIEKIKEKNGNYELLKTYNNI